MEKPVPFSPPRIDDRICDEVVKTLKSGWITTGPRTKLFEKKIAEYCGVPSVVCLNSATAGLELMLRWFGVGEGDEVILPAYTYSATANVVVHCGARPVLVDVREDDFNISAERISAAITARTKVIMPVDFGGMPCDYDAIRDVIRHAAPRFVARGEEQEKLGRILLLADAAHSFGATYKGRKSGSLCDVSVFSFHAVKNLTTAEGGAVSLNLPPPFDNQEIYRALCIKSLHGQTKDALAKTAPGAWRYDIIEPGYKCNMTDIAAAIGLVELERYDSDTLPKRKAIADNYAKLLSKHQSIRLPVFESSQATSSYHLYPVRLKTATEEQRDAVISHIAATNVSVNVHFLPLPMLSFYRAMGYEMKNYPQAYENYSREITLPLFYDLTEEQQKRVADALLKAVDTIC